MGYIIILPIPFDVLDPAIAEMLGYFPRGFVNFTRKEITPNSAIYYISQESFGEIGELRIGRLTNNQSELYKRETTSNATREFSSQEIVAIKSQIDREEKHRLIIDINKKIHEEKKLIDKRKSDHFESIVAGLMYHLKSDPFTWPPSEQPTDNLNDCLDDFCRYVKSEIRMSFWNNDRQNNHSWKSKPENHAKILLMTHLNGKFGKSVKTYSELVAGAGKIDIYFECQSEKAIIELKMCGHHYSSSYGLKGIEQIKHYMDNKKVDKGFLLVFDSRTKDFGKGFDDYNLNIVIKFIDVRPTIIN